MIDRLVRADGRNPDSTLTHGNNPTRRSGWSCENSVIAL